MMVMTTLRNASANALVVLVASITLIATVATESPNVQISLTGRNLKDRPFGGNILGAIKPSVGWDSTTFTAADGQIDLAYGIDVTATTEGPIRRSLWGKASSTRDLAGFDLAGRAEIDLFRDRSLYIDLDVERPDVDMQMKFMASLRNGRFGVDAITATKELQAGNTHITVTPRFDVGNNINDVVVDYTVGGKRNKKSNVFPQTDVTIIASGDAQSITVSQQLDRDNKFSPTLSSTGELSLLWERRLKDDSTVTSVLRPNQSLEVRYTRDDMWEAELELPIDGSSLSQGSISIRKNALF